MTVLITGGGGFLGAWIIRRLAARGIELRVSDRGDDRGIVRAIAGAAADRLDWRTGDVASQLEKLEAMMQRGTLTADEFQAHKDRLLGR